MMKVEMRPLGSAEVQAQSDDDLKKIITEGKGKMRPVASVTGKSVDDVVAYVRTLEEIGGVWDPSVSPSRTWPETPRLYFFNL